VQQGEIKSTFARPINQTRRSFYCNQGARREGVFEMNFLATTLRRQRSVGTVTMGVTAGRGAVSPSTVVINSLIVATA